jgi:hypothetical protein
MKIIPINRDVNKSDLPNGTLIHSANIEINKQYNSYTNLKGMGIQKEYKNYDICGIIDGPMSIIYFLKNKTNNESLIVRFMNNTYTDIIIDALLNFDVDRPIQGVQTFNNKQENIIIFWEVYGSINPPRYLNIDCMPFTLNPSKGFSSLGDVELLNLFLPTGNTNIILDEVFNAGGLLETGVYWVAIKGKLYDNSTSNIIGISAPIVISAKDSLSSYLQNDKPSGIQVNKSFDVLISGLDYNYPKIEVYVGTKIENQFRAFLFGEFSGDFSTPYKMRVDTLLDKPEIPIEELFIPSVGFKSVRSGTLINGRLALANVEYYSDNLNLQLIANNVQIKWTKNTTPIKLVGYKNSFLDPKTIPLKGFRAGEVYAFYIAFKYKNGEWSKAYHIPGRAPVLGETDPVIQKYENAPHIIRNFEVTETADATGKMGYWENKDEVYDSCSWQVGKVRHHRFPTLYSLEDWGFPFIENDYNTADWNATFNTSLAVSNSTSGFGDDDGFLGIAYPTTHENVASIKNTTGSTQILTFGINSDLTVTSPSGSLPKAITVRAIIYKRTFLTGSIPEYDIIYEESFVDIGAHINKMFTIEIPNNYGVAVIVRANGSTPFTGSLIVNGKMESTGNLFYRPLGIDVSNVVIPSNLQKDIIGWSIFYAERNNLNSLVCASGLIQDYKHRSGASGEYQKLHNFDMLVDRYRFPDYMRLEYEYQRSSITIPQNKFIRASVNAISDQYWYPFYEINKPAYIPKNTKGSSLTAPAFEEHFEFNLFRPIRTFVNDSINGYFYYVTSYYLNPNCYYNYRNQTLLFTGRIVSPTTTSSNAIVGGDTYVGLQVANANLKENTNNTVYKECFIDCYVELNNNINFRYVESTNWWEFYSADKLPYTIPVPSGGDPTLLYGDTYRYDKTFTCFHLEKVFPAPCENICNNNLTEPYLIARSAKRDNNSNVENLRTFLALDYYNIQDKTKGKITNIAALGRSLIINMEFTTYVAEIKDVVQNNSALSIYLGTGDIFDRDPIEVAPDYVGKAGCDSKWSCRVTENGYIFADRNKGKVYLFDGKLNDISEMGLKFYFDNNLNHNFTIDNPYKYQGLFGIFKSDKYYLIKSSPVNNDCFIYVFDFDFKGWISDHTHGANLAAINKDNLQFIRSFINDDVTIISDSVPANYCVFFDKDMPALPSYVDILLNPKATTNKIWDSILWNTDVYDNNGRLILDTITHIMIYTENQCTGLIPINVKENLVFGHKNSANSVNTWAFNKIRDVLKNKETYFLDKKFNLDTTNITASRDWFKKGNFFNDWVIVRLYIDNLKNQRYFIKDLFSNAKNRIK